MLPLHTSLRGLRCFCVAAECLSFKETAKRLYLTPSAVSHQIKQLETQLDQTLFIRQTRAITLSETGLQFYQRILPLMTELSEAVNEFNPNQTPLEVSISMPEFFASELFVPQLVSWSAKYPHINLKLDTIKSRTEQQTSTQVSIVLSGRRQNSDHAYDLFPLEYVPACNKTLFQQIHHLGFKALSQTPLILHKARPHAWHQWANNIGFDDFKPKQIIQLDSMFSVARAAEQGIGIALIPLPISQAWFDNHSLVKLFPQSLTSHDRYYLINHQGDNTSKEVQLLIEWIKETFTPN